MYISMLCIKLMQVQNDKRANDFSEISTLQNSFKMFCH